MLPSDEALALLFLVAPLWNQPGFQEFRSVVARKRAGRQFMGLEVEALQLGPNLTQRLLATEEAVERAGGVPTFTVQVPSDEVVCGDQPFGDFQQELVILQRRDPFARGDLCPQHPAGFQQKKAKGRGMHDHPVTLGLDLAPLPVSDLLNLLEYLCTLLSKALCLLLLLALKPLNLSFGKTEPFRGLLRLLLSLVEHLLVQPTRPFRLSLGSPFFSQLCPTPAPTTQTRSKPWDCEQEQG